MKRSICLLAVAAVMLFASCGGCGKDKVNSSLDLENRDKFEEMTFAKSESADGIYTTYQISGAYSSSSAMPTDAVMVYSSNIAGVEGAVASYLNKGYKQVDLMIPNGRDMGSYFIDGNYDGRTHHDLVQKDIDGGWHQHTPGNYYIHPDDSFNNYLIDWCKRAIAAGAKDIYIEEPDGYIDYCYSDYFKSLWKEKYGTDFFNNAEEDLEFRTKTLDIVQKIFVDSYDKVSAGIKETYPESKVYIATHSISGYSSMIVANNGAMLSLGGIDGVIGQSWTNTSMQPIYFEGGKQPMYFENSYMEYSELVNYTVGNGKKAYMLNDASADGGYTYDVCRPIWEHNIAAQMMMPDVYCFESSVWPERAFTNAPIEYKAVQEGIYRLQSEVHGYDSTTYSGTNGIGIVTSYTGTSSFIDFGNSLSSLVTPLVRQGIPVDVMALETLWSAESLKDIDVLILSYDFIKPTDSRFVKTIADWVKGGGTLVYLGGYNFAQSFSGEWKDAGFATPQDQLFSMLGLKVTGHSMHTGGKTLEAEKGNPSYLSGTSVYNGQRTTFTSYAAEDVTPLYRADGSMIAFEGKAGEGNVVVCGVEPLGMSFAENVYGELYEKLIMRAVDLAGKQYYAPGAMYTLRGDYVFAHSFTKEIKLSGTYIDLFSDDFDIVTDPTVKQGESAAFKRISSNEGISYSNFAVDNVIESGGYSFTAANVFGSKAQFVYKLPNGMDDATVTASFVMTGDEPNNFTETKLGGGYIRVSWSVSRNDKVNVKLSY